MSSWASQLLDANYNSMMADDARVTPASNAAAFQIRVFPLSEDQTLGLGLQAQPITGVQLLEVRKSDWPAPVPTDRVDILSDIDGSVTRSLQVVDEPLSLDDKRLTWTLNCTEL
ncbi:MAG: hypothetical protein AAFW60_00655 [Pseudomonadota bacterium]